MRGRGEAKGKARSNGWASERKMRKERARKKRQRDHFRLTLVVEFELRMSCDDGGEETQLTLVTAKIGRHDVGR